MLAKLIERPIAVTMTVIAVIVVGIVSIGQLPVSLMPDVEIPQVTVQLEKPGFSARVTVSVRLSEPFLSLGADTLIFALTLSNWLLTITRFLSSLSPLAYANIDSSTP